VCRDVVPLTLSPHQKRGEVSGEALIGQPLDLKEMPRSRPEVGQWIPAAQLPSREEVSGSTRCSSTIPGG
jgi:hypothetical protein